VSPLFFVDWEIAYHLGLHERSSLKKPSSPPVSHFIEKVFSFTVFGLLRCAPGPPPPVPWFACPPPPVPPLWFFWRIFLSPPSRVGGFFFLFLCCSCFESYNEGVHGLVWPPPLRMLSSDVFWLILIFFFIVLFLCPFRFSGALFVTLAVNSSPPVIDVFSFHSPPPFA